VPRKELAHSYEAQICQIRVPISITFGKIQDLSEVFSQIETELQKSLSHQSENGEKTSELT